MTEDEILTFERDDVEFRRLQPALLGFWNAFTEIGSYPDVKLRLVAAIEHARAALGLPTVPIPIVSLPGAIYDPAYGDYRPCSRSGCGHAYHQHFDSYEDMYPVGCKYCECPRFVTPGETLHG